MKLANVLCFFQSDGRRRVVFCDMGALVELGRPGTVTYPPPAHPTGLDVPVTEAVMLWGLAALLLCAALNDYGLGMCHRQARGAARDLSKKQRSFWMLWSLRARCDRMVGSPGARPSPRRRYP